MNEQEIKELQKFTETLKFKKGSIISVLWSLYRMHRWHKKRDLSCIYQVTLGKDL